MVSKTSHETISLKEHFEKMFIEKDKAIATALSAAKEAVIIAEQNSQKWRENANEWRGAMTDREKNFMTRNEFMAYKETADEASSEIRQKLDTLLGRKQGLTDGWGWLVGLIGTLLAVASYLR